MVARARAVSRVRVSCMVAMVGRGWSALGCLKIAQDVDGGEGQAGVRPLVAHRAKLHFLNARSRFGRGFLEAFYSKFAN